VYDICTSKIDDCCGNKEIEEIMEEVEDGDKDNMLMNMLIKTTVTSIIQNEIIHLSNQINAYQKLIPLNMLNLPDEKLVSLANLENLKQDKQDKIRELKII